MDISGFENILNNIQSNENNNNFKAKTTNSTKNKNQLLNKEKLLQDLQEQLSSKTPTNNIMQNKNHNQQTIHSGHRQRARDRFLLNPSGVSDYDLLELLLFLIIPRVDTKPMAKMLIDKYKSIRNIFNAEINELNKLGVNGNAVKYLYTLMKIFNQRILLQQIKEKKFNPQNLEDIIKYCQNLIGDKQQEAFYILFFDTKLKLILSQNLGITDVQQAIISVRDIIKQSLDINATNIVLTHNHPSGDVEPSNEDIQTTMAIKEALKTINIDILDHIIVSGGKYFSMQENNLLS